MISLDIQKEVSAINIFFDIDDTLVDYDLVEKADSYKDIPLLPGALKFIQNRQLAGDNLYIISWYNPENLERMKSKYEWCFRNLPMIQYEHLMIIPAPTNKADKAKKIMEMDVLTKNEILFDDNKDNIKAWKEAGGMPYQFDKKTMSWEEF